MVYLLDSAWGWTGRSASAPFRKRVERVLQDFDDVVVVRRDNIDPVVSAVADELAGTDDQPRSWVEREFRA